MSEPGSTSDVSRRHSTSQYRTADGVRFGRGKCEAPEMRTQYD